MTDIKINGDKFLINDSQKEELITKLNEIKQEEGNGTYRFTEDLSDLPPIIQIVIGGLVWDLGKQTFKNYRNIIMDIIRRG